MRSFYLGGYRLIAKLQRDQVRDSYLARRDDPARSQEMVVLTRLRNARGPGNQPPLRAEVPPDVDLIPLLSHPNIVATHEFNHSGATPYWVTEYIEGQPLERVLEAAPGFPITLALHVLCSVLAALDHAHNLVAGGETITIVHGDVRPQNVYLTYEGEVKLAGFGVPRLRSSDTERSLPSRADRGVDLLAAGLLMRELLSQRVRASFLDAQVMQILAPIYERAQDRYATAEDMRGDLLEVLERLNEQNTDLTAGLKALMRQLFERERRDYTRRISLLVAIDNSLEPSGEREEPGREFVTTDLRLPTFLRLAPATQTELQPPAAEPRVPASHPPVSVPRSSQPQFAAQTWFDARMPNILIAGVIMSLIAFIWSFSHSEAPADKAAAATNTKPQPSTVLRLCGSNTIGAELAPALVEALFANKNNASKVSHERATDSSRSIIRAGIGNQELSAEISALGTSTGFAGLGDGACDIAMASRAVNGVEAAELLAKGVGDLLSSANEHVIGLDGVAMIVHPDNPVSVLTRFALHDVFTGKIKNWSALGGADLEIHLLARDDKSGTYDTFQHLILGAEKIGPGAQRHTSNAALADAVALDPAAIGFVGLAYVRSAKALAVSDAGAAPRLPTPFTVATESYLLTRRLYLYTTSEPRTAWVSELINFALSPAGQAIAKKTGFIDLTPLVDSSHCNECSPRYRGITANAVRASVDIRFQSGRIVPDGRARHDFYRLVVLLNEYRRAKVILLGFSDGLGNPNENLKISYERANIVAQELAVRGIQASVVLGFGSENPVTSNDTPEGRERNRRVEVWLQQR